MTITVNLRRCVVYENTGVIVTAFLDDKLNDFKIPRFSGCMLLNMQAKKKPFLVMSKTENERGG